MTARLSLWVDVFEPSIYERKHEQMKAQACETETSPMPPMQPLRLHAILSEFLWAAHRNSNTHTWYWFSSVRWLSCMGISNGLVLNLGQRKAQSDMKCLFSSRGAFSEMVDAKESWWSKHERSYSIRNVIHEGAKRTRMLVIGMPAEEFETATPSLFLHVHDSIQH